MKKRLIPLFIIALLSLALTAAGCQKTEPAAEKKDGGEKSAKPSGTVKISGAWALYPMVVKWAEEFQKINPDVRIDVSAGGAGKGAADALGGLVDIGMVSRGIKPEEEAQDGFWVAVTRDAVLPTISDGNPVLWKGLADKGLKKSVFEDLWIKEKKLTWGEIAGVADDKSPVTVFTRSDACGAAESWAKYLGDKKQEDLKGTGVYGDPGVAEAVKKDINGIGYNNLNYAYDAATGLPVSGLFIVPIDVNNNGKVDPEEDLKTKKKAIAAIVSGAYPSPPARDLNLLTKGEFKGAAKSFVEWILTDGQKYVEEVGYIKLPAKQLKEEQSKLGSE